MENHSTLAIAAMLSMMFGGSSPVTAEPLSDGEILHALPLRLARPQWRPLTAQEIGSRISDKIVVIEKEYEPVAGVKLTASYMGGCPPSETFFADGRWEMGVCHRAPRTFKGRWFTEAFRGGERLCTIANDYPKVCRVVWQGSAFDQIVMSQQSFAAANEIADDFNAYRVTPRETEASR